MSGPVGVLLDLLFPPKCVFCGRLLTSGERDFCARCQRELPWLEGPEAEQTGEFFTLCASPLAYRDQVRDSIRRYKFKGRQGYHKAYGRLVAQCVHDHLDGRWDLITWVPLSDQRRRERGYDQAFLLASAAALELGEVAVETLRKPLPLLRKTVHNPAQSGLKEAAARRANVLGAYTAVDAELVEGKRVLLIDDVITTGATISECARILRTVGAREVVCATLARARG
jgi:competence protein ComFC